MTSPKRILLLHHDEASLIALQWLLENQGYDTTATWEHAEAYNLLDSSDFDIVVLHERCLAENPALLFHQVKRPQTRVVIPLQGRLTPERVAAKTYPSSHAAKAS